MTEKLGEYFDNLALAATAKNETIDSLAQAINELTSDNAELTVTVNKLNPQLDTELNQNRSRNNNNNNKDCNNQNNNNNNSQKWPSWCDPDAYCSTCSYKLRKVRDSRNCLRAKDDPDHKKEATR